MPSREAKRFPAALTLSLDADTWEQLEQMASQQSLGVEDWVKALIEKALRQEAKQVRRLRGASVARDLAPLDAFLPEGTDPFTPHEFGEPSPRSSFEDIQNRMRFAGTPALLR